MVSHGVGAFVPEWKPIVTKTKVTLNLLGEGKVDWPEMAVLCDKERSATKLVEWIPSGIRKCVTLSDARPQDQLRKVKPDGNCWCNALAWGISSQHPEMGTEYSPVRIREIAVQGLLENADFLMSYFVI